MTKYFRLRRTDGPDTNTELRRGSVHVRERESDVTTFKPTCRLFQHSPSVHLAPRRRIPLSRTGASPGGEIQNFRSQFSFVSFDTEQNLSGYFIIIEIK